MPGIIINRTNLTYQFYNAVYTVTASTNNATLLNVYHDDFAGDIQPQLFYITTGTYSLKSTIGIFDINKTSLFLSTVYKQSDVIPSVVTWEVSNANTILIKTYRTNTGALNNCGFSLNIEVRNYYSYIIGQ
jgi:hypothetical protein